MTVFRGVLDASSQIGIPIWKSVRRAVISAVPIREKFWLVQAVRC
jgi:hypothetical protein